jgi:type III pantothenate kinase
MGEGGAAAAASTWVVDVGNTRTAFGALDSEGRVVDVFRTPTPRREGDAADLPRLPTPRRIVAIGVVRSAVDLWTKACSAAGLPTPEWHGTPERPLSVAHPYEAPRLPGPDRLAMAHGAFVRAAGPAIVVSAGTALVCDLVDGAGAFWGGSIAPGYRAMARGLAAAAPELPEAFAAVEWTTPAMSSEAAVLSGVSAAARGATRELVLRAEAAFGMRPRLFVTGGDADRAAAYLADRRPEVAPNLALEGLARLLVAP